MFTIEIYCIYFLYRIEGKRPTLARAIALSSEDCMLEIFKPIGRSSTTYSEEPLRSGTFERSVILACKIPIEKSEVSKPDGDIERRLVMSQTPTEILRRLNINWNQ